MTQKVAPKLPARAFAPLAAVLVLAPACYSTTPHRAEVASNAAPKRCADAVSDVFAKSGFIQLPTPPHLTMFFGPRTGGPYSSFLATNSGVGVTVDHGAAPDDCHVTIEALSPDAGCAGTSAGPSGTLNCQRTGATDAVSRMGGTAVAPMCPVLPGPICELSSAPGADNDAAVDELARRVQAALGERGAVN